METTPRDREQPYERPAVDESFRRATDLNAFYNGAPAAVRIRMWKALRKNAPTKQAEQ